MKTKNIEKTSAKGTDLKKAPDIKKAEMATDKTNVESAAQKIQYDRILKWHYPEDCITAKDRKVFRAKSRNSIRRLEARALKIGKETKEGLKLIADALEIRKTALVEPNIQI